MTLAAHDLIVDLGSNRVLNGIDLTVSPGEMLAIVGPNGSGKSTLLRAIAGLLRPAGGGTSLDTKPLHRYPKRALARRRALLTQSADLPQLTTVREHVAMGRHAYTNPLSSLFRTADQTTHNAAIDAAMERCGVAHLAHRRMEALSGGERQRVRLATTLAQQPDILLLDEPLTGLDIEHQLGLLDLLTDLNTATSTTVVCVIHDLGLALRHFPRIVAVHQGRLAADGPGDRVLDAQILSNVFGVDGCACFDLPGHPVVVCRSQARNERGRQPRPEVVTPSLDYQPIPR